MPFGEIMKIYKSEDLIAEGHSIGIFLSDNNIGEDAHSHEFIEIIYITTKSA